MMQPLILANTRKKKEDSKTGLMSLNIEDFFHEDSRSYLKPVEGKLKRVSVTSSKVLSMQFMVYGSIRQH